MDWTQQVRDWTQLERDKGIASDGLDTAGETGHRWDGLSTAVLDMATTGDGLGRVENGHEQGTAGCGWMWTRHVRGWTGYSW